MKFKYAKQALVYLVEIFVVTTLLVYISQKFKICENWYEIFERYTVVFVLYQGLVFLFNSNFLDVKKDICLSYKTYLNKSLLFLEYKNSNLLEELEYKKNSIISNKVFIDKLYINKFKGIYELISDDSKSDREKELTIKYEIIDVEHSIEFEALGWRFSLLLKFFK